jgi:hypothetical protein
VPAVLENAELARLFETGTISTAAQKRLQHCLDLELDQGLDGVLFG